jgi:transposase
MEQRVVYRYSMAFKKQVVDDIESGRFGIGEARQHYGIAGSDTIQAWIRKFGRNKLLNKVVRVEKFNEKDEIRQLKQQVRQLQQLLGKKEAEKAIGDAYLELACEELGVDVDEFKKKGRGGQLMGQSEGPAKE